MNYSDAADDKNAGGTNYDRLLNYCGEPIHHTRIQLTMASADFYENTAVCVFWFVPHGENRNGMPGPKLYRVFTGP
jgi:hypothetical protein